MVATVSTWAVFIFLIYLIIYFYGEEGKRPAVFDCLLIRIAEKLFDS